ncbi:autotransporter-associated beta strand repeat-containing protein [Rariglobus hedericola]|uniref:autotransporter-associated beta strand repeat-containing protein n=1 Tax=Rariglobus hedericola TaxID=2597822 RepID=UPI0023B18AC1|nr:autotransporter-associated beta strand repeat-containing protein [Rariglobus hedericola]
MARRDSLNFGTGAVLMEASETMTVNGSTLTMGGVISSSEGGGITKAGAGTLELGGANLYNGATLVNAGTLLVNGSLASGSVVTVNSGGTLGGSGTINGATTIATGGTLAPGNSPGLLTFGSNLTLATGSTTVFQIDGTNRGTTYDAINLTTGTLTYDGAFNLVFGTTVQDGTALDFFRLSGNGSTGSFSSILASGSYSGLFTNDGGVWTLVNGAQTLTFSQTTGDLSFSSAAVPELSTYTALFGACSLGVAAWQRRRKLRAA